MIRLLSAVLFVTASIALAPAIAASKDALDKDVRNALNDLCLFDQKGLMAGMGIQGTKVSKIEG